MINILVYGEQTGLKGVPLSELKKWDYNCEEKIWIDIYDTSSEESTRILSEIFGFHPLTIEDSLKYIQDSKIHHPKIDDFGDYLFIVFNGILKDSSQSKIKYFSLSCFLGHNFLVTIHNEKPVNTIDTSIRNSINASTFRKGPDYLLHLIFDSIVDNYYPILDDFEEKINTVEDVMFKDTSSNSLLVSILALKKELIRLMRFSSYQKEVLFKLTRADSDLISTEESIYYRNVYDHLVRIADASESYRDYVTGVLESYLSIVNNRLNETMKFLTMVATIMLPMTFITGLFGMNFDHIPFLHSPLGFVISLVIMISIAGVMYFWFKKRKVI
ncbi:MAG: magnesium/cobalt transporter CorA [Ignavibacteria bacterium]|nr:magnesium/cobalt transporter CorA [Ignavibacteria bacterium]MBK6878177.1 magnesium/cobalt transporter CorA [Ignavibacteria bacterium]